VRKLWRRGTFWIRIGSGVGKSSGRARLVLENSFMRMRGIPKAQPEGGAPKPVAEHITQTVETIAELHAAAERAMTRHQRSVEAIADHLGQPRATYWIGAGVLLWIAVNLLLLMTRARPFDPPPFPLLQAVSSVAALLVATVVLTSQNRQRKVTEERTTLDLQVNLLAERKVAKLIALVEELRRDMPNVANRKDAIAESMTHAVDPHAVVSALRETIDTERREREEAEST
jgi:uncharacterized membrane protein